jgi:hypothetical protein
MAKADEKVMAWVEAELAKNPDAPSGVLFEAAKEKFPSIASLSIRQFHARYPLQVKRKASASKPRKRTRDAGRRGATTGRAGTRDRRSKTPPPDAREAVRAVLMRFATELASADAKADVVKVLARTDRYVDDVLSAAGY